MKKCISLGTPFYVFAIATFGSDTALIRYLQYFSKTRVSNESGCFAPNCSTNATFLKGDNFWCLQWELR